MVADYINCIMYIGYWNVEFSSCKPLLMNIYLLFFQNNSGHLKIPDGKCESTDRPLSPSMTRAHPKRNLPWSHSTALRNGESLFLKLNRGMNLKEADEKRDLFIWTCGSIVTKIYNFAPLNLLVFNYVWTQIPLIVKLEISTHVQYMYMPEGPT